MSFGYKNNCVPVAFMFAKECSYEEAHAACVEFGHWNERDGVIGLYFEHIAKALGLKLTRISSTRSINGRIERTPSGRSKHMTLGQFLKAYPEGTYIIGTNGHAFTVKDGYIHDWAETGMKARIWTIDKVESSSNF